MFLRIRSTRISADYIEKGVFRVLKLKKFHLLFFQQKLNINLKMFKGSEIEQQM